MLEFQWLWGFLLWEFWGCIEVGGGGLEVAQRVDFGGVGCGRAWVISLPKFFLGKYFQFWKLPPLFCINSMDNVYYPIFLGSIWYTVLTVEYTGNCIIGIGASVKILLKNERFSLGKAREGVFSLPNHPHSIHKTIHTNKIIHTLLITLQVTTPSPHRLTTLLFPALPHHTHQRP